MRTTAQHLWENARTLHGGLREMVSSSHHTPHRQLSRNLDDQTRRAMWQALLEAGLYVTWRAHRRRAGTYLLRCSLCAEHTASSRDDPDMFRARRRLGVSPDAGSPASHESRAGRIARHERNEADAAARAAAEQLAHDHADRDARWARSCSSRWCHLARQSRTRPALHCRPTAMSDDPRADAVRHDRQSEASLGRYVISADAASPALLRSMEAGRRQSTGSPDHKTTPRCSAINALRYRLSDTRRQLATIALSSATNRTRRPWRYYARAAPALTQINRLLETIIGRERALSSRTNDAMPRSHGRATRDV